MKQLFVLIGVLVALSAKAQEKQDFRHLFSIDVGIGSLYDVRHDDNVYDYDILPMIYSSRDYHLAQYYKDNTYHPALVDVNYRYLASKHWAYGVTAGFHTFYQKWREIATGSTYRESRETNLSIMGVGRYYWRTKNWVRTYSELGLGIRTHWKKGFYDESYQMKNDITGHITLLGVEVGNKHLIGFGEFGVGALGLFRGGIGYRF